MNKKVIIILISLLLSVVGYSQHQKINFSLRAALEKQENKSSYFSIIVRGDVGAIKKEVLKLKGFVGLSSKDIVKVKLQVNQIAAFSANSFVQSIEYSTSGVQVLNDTLKYNNNVVPVNNGTAPLLQAYTGKGVLLGLIDAGIDVTHADFKDALGNTRILRLWDQTKTDNGTSLHGYGVVWDSSAINNNTTNHKDPFAYKAHGSHVTGIAVGNGLAVNNYSGVAPDADIIAVAVDFESNENTILDAVDYIYKVADSLGMPCVINVSLGDYAGSHDGTDGAAVLIDSLVNAKPGRAFVCAAGNAGSIAFHLQHNVNSDTTFTWFQYDATSFLGYGAVYYEIWADTADLNNVDFSVGMNLPSGSFELRGKTPFDNIQNRLGTVTDTIKNNGNVLGIVETYGEIQGDKYLLQIHIKEPDSNAYYFSLMTTGNGKLDIWSKTNVTGTANMVTTGLPTVGVYPNIVYYQLPDTSQTIVSSFTCLPSIIAVGTYLNRKTYVDVNGITQYTAGNVGQIDVGSSIGPTRRGLTKPEVASTGRYVMSTTSDTVATWAIGIGASFYVGFGGKHVLKNGTSMASPVVAGIALLYMEKCPNATMAEIRQAILNTSTQDAFTGATPNNSYGYGKADAFAALNTSNFNYSLGNNKNVCDGDSLEITAPGFASYLWSTNDTSSSIFVDSTENVFVQLSNNSGCIGLSDTVTVTWQALPIKPIITVQGNDTLIYSTALGLQWYFNNGTLNGEVDTFHIAQNNGDYFVQVSNSFGCVANSDTVSVIILGIENNNAEVANVYPNPTTNSVNIQLTDKSIHTIQIINALGEVLIDQKATVTTLNINLSNLAEGVYYIRFINEKMQHLQKLILLR